MQDEFYAAAEKILSDLYTLFSKDPKLKSFEILPVVQIENKSPIHVEEHCLALESWCVPHIYCYAYKNLMNHRQIKGKLRDVEKCNTLLMGALLLNPDITTFWNMRKELIRSGKLDPYFDLHFTSVILTFKPKCADLYSFRKWILKYLVQSSRNNINLYENEIQICEAAAHRYSNNYHAWTHRIWCLTQSFPNSLQREWAASMKWVQRHVSDYSGFHYRQKLITFLLSYIESRSYDEEVIKLILFSVDEATSGFLHNFKTYELSAQTIPLALKIFIYELSLNSDLIWNFVGHEALWCHRRFIFHETKRLLLDSNCTKYWGRIDVCNPADGTPPEKTLKIGKHSVGSEFSLILSIYEDMFLSKCSDEREPRQMLYANKHKQWLAKFSKFRLPLNEDRDNPVFRVSSI